MGPDEENEKGTDVPCRICGHDVCRLDIESGVCLRCRRHLGPNEPMLEMWATVMDRIRKLERDARRVITAEEIRDTEPAKKLREIGERISELGKSSSRTYRQTYCEPCGLLWMGVKRNARIMGREPLCPFCSSHLTDYTMPKG